MNGLWPVRAMARLFVAAAAAGVLAAHPNGAVPAPLSSAAPSPVQPQPLATQCGVLGDGGVAKVLGGPVLVDTGDLGGHVLGGGARSAGSRMCARVFMTNCTSRQDELHLCPSECPFLSSSPFSKCAAACVAAEDCGNHRRALPFANIRTRRCEACPSFGCAECDTHSQGGVLTCRRCREGFLLVGTTCIYKYDSAIVVAYGVLALLVVAAVAGLAAALKAFDGNAGALHRGTEHWARCLPHVAQTAPTSLKQTMEADAAVHFNSPLYPLAVDVHRQNVVGVGLALYYNHLVFVAITASLCWFVLGFGEDLFGLQRWSVFDCSYNTVSDVEGVKAAYSRRRCAIAALCWAVLLPASVNFARYQAAAERTFDTVHTRMEDYALSIRGLPETATDPLEIKRWIEDLLGDAIEGVSIAYDYRHCRQEVGRLLDEHVGRRDVAFEAALGVPCASYRSRPRSSAMPALSEGEELLSEGSGGGGPQRRAGSSASPDCRRQTPRELLGSLRSTGEAFVVVRREDDVDRIFALWDGPGSAGLHRTGSFFSMRTGGVEGDASPMHGTVDPTEPVPDEESSGAHDPRKFDGFMLPELREVSSEPTSVVWDQMGISERALIRWAVALVAAFMVAAATFNSLLYAPYFQYVLDYARKAGQPPTAIQTCGLGVVVSLGNTLIANAIWVGVPWLGFQRKDQADIVTFAVRWVLVLLNTVIIVVLTAQKLAAVVGPDHSRGNPLAEGAADRALANSEELGREAALASNVFVMFLTGAFSVSYVCFWCSYPLTYYASVLAIKSGLIEPSMSVRACERILSPMEIWLPWDYASHIQLTCCAFMPLFLAEPSGHSASRRLCLVLFAWCCVMYCAQRVVHLRFSRETFFTTGRLDKAVLAAWAFPLSMLAMASVFWLARSFQLGLVGKVVFCGAAFAGSCSIYWWFLFQHALRPPHHGAMSAALNIGKEKEPYKAALARLRYSYFNTNPVHVLLSEYFPEMGLEPVTFYDAGKAYLQATDPKVHARLQASQLAAEIAPEAGSAGGLAYRARVWLAGAPQRAFQTLS